MRRYTVRVNETDHVMDVEELAADTFTVHLSDGRLVDVVLTDHQDLAQAVIAPQVEVGHPRTPARTVTAPMPGVILSVAVAAGATVQRGQTLMVLEAMKMKNDLKAQREGTVSQVFVSDGDQVKHGDLLLKFQG